MCARQSRQDLLGPSPPIVLSGKGPRARATRRAPGTDAPRGADAGKRRLHEDRSALRFDSMPFKFTKLSIPDVILAEYLAVQDDRGFFTETYEARAFAEAGISQPFVQDNQSGSRRSVLRGLHYQINHPQGKLVRVLSGEVFDVAVDLRRHSPSFKQWLGVRLSAEGRTAALDPGRVRSRLLCAERVGRGSIQDNGLLHSGVGTDAALERSGAWRSNGRSTKALSRSSRIGIPTG